MPYNREKLLEPFDQSLVKEFKGRGGVPLSYIPHPVIRRRLLDWGGEVKFIASEPQVLGSAIVVTATMTIDGVAHTEVGSEPVPTSPLMMADAVKMAMSDAWKRCAMSHGIGLELWEPEEKMYRDVFENEPVMTRVGPGPERVDYPPRQRPAQPIRQQPAQQRTGTFDPNGAWRDRPASDKAKNLCRGLARTYFGPDTVEGELQAMALFYSDSATMSLDELTGGQVSDMIDDLKKKVESEQF
jgi:hypothetical protein